MLSDCVCRVLLMRGYSYSSRGLPHGYFLFAPKIRNCRNAQVVRLLRALGTLAHKKSIALSRALAVVSLAVGSAVSLSREHTGA